MNIEYKRKSVSLSQRIRLMELFLEMAQQAPSYLLAERQLDRADTYYRQALAMLTPEDKKAIESYFRAVDSLADATAAIAFFMGVAEGRRQKRRLQSRLRRGKV